MLHEYTVTQQKEVDDEKIYPLAYTEDYRVQANAECLRAVGQLAETSTILIIRLTTVRNGEKKPRKMYIETEPCVKKKLNFSDKSSNIKERRYSEYHQSQSNGKNH